MGKMTTKPHDETLQHLLKKFMNHLFSCVTHSTKEFHKNKHCARDLFVLLNFISFIKLKIF